MDIVLKRILELIGDKHGATKGLASVLGIAPNSITNWKNGHSRSYTKYLPQIASYYGVSLDWLSGLTDEKVQKEKPTVEDDELSKRKREYIETLKTMDEAALAVALAAAKAVVSQRGKDKE